MDSSSTAWSPSSLLPAAELLPDLAAARLARLARLVSSITVGSRLLPPRLLARGGACSLVGERPSSSSPGSPSSYSDLDRRHLLALRGRSGGHLDVGRSAEYGHSS